MSKKADTKLNKYALDNSSQFYPIMASKTKQSLYRLTAELDLEVNPETLEEAVNGVMHRFPTFATRLKKGYAWFYLLQNDAHVKVFENDGVLLRPITEEETNGYMFRVLYTKNTIALEVFHGLCDGNGAYAFLFAVIQKYRSLEDVVFDAADGLMNLDSEPTECETEDAFKHYYRKIKLKEIGLKELTGGAPLLLSGTVADRFICDSFTATYSDVSAHAKALGATFTSFTAGLLAFTVASQEKGTKPIVMMVPVNLRKLFPSDNVRNFVLFVRLVFNVKKCKTIEDFVTEANVQLKREAALNKMEAMISTTVRAEKALDVVPLWFKTAVAKFVRSFLKSRQTVIFSNLGDLTASSKLGVKRVIFTMNASKTSKVNLGITSYGGEVVMSFMRSIEETDLQDGYVAELNKLGVAVKKL